MNEGKKEKDGLKKKDVETKEVEIELENANDGFVEIAIRGVSLEIMVSLEAHHSLSYQAPQLTPALKYPSSYDCPLQLKLSLMKITPHLQTPSVSQSITIEISFTLPAHIATLQITGI